MGSDHDQPGRGDWVCYASRPFARTAKADAVTHLGRVTGITRFRGGHVKVLGLGPRSDASDHPVPLDDVEGILRPDTKAGARRVAGLCASEEPRVREMAMQLLADCPGLGDNVTDPRGDEEHQRAQNAARARESILAEFASWESSR